MIFNHVSFLNESSSTKKMGFELRKNIINEGGSLIKNCDFAICDDLIFESAFNESIIEECALLEGAKLDLKLKNFLKEGEDYKGLKKDLREIIDANNLSDEELKSGKNGFMHVCKRILQCCSDILIFTGAASTVVQTGSAIAAAVAAGQPGLLLVAIVPSIIGYVIGFIINRVERLLWDTIEFETVKKDAQTIVSDLRKTAAKNPKMADRLNKEADRLEESIKKYSQKRKEKED